MNEQPSALLTDLYQINMIQAYLDHGETETAVFELFVRNLPPRRGFLVAAGLEQALDYLEGLRFSTAEIEWLEPAGSVKTCWITSPRFVSPATSTRCPKARCFLPTNHSAHHRPATAGAIRRVAADQHPAFPDFDRGKSGAYGAGSAEQASRRLRLRRAHGAEAGLMAARASYLVGFAGTATVFAGEAFGIPLYGTMAHSFIEAFDDEMAAFAAFAQSRPDNLVFLLDTYDTEVAAKKVVALAPRLKRRGSRTRCSSRFRRSRGAVAEGPRHPRRRRAARCDDLCQRRSRRGFARHVDAGECAD